MPSDWQLKHCILTITDGQTASLPIVCHLCIQPPRFILAIIKLMQTV